MTGAASPAALSPACRRASGPGPTAAPRVTVVVPSWNTRAHLERCLAAVRRAEAELAEPDRPAGGPRGALELVVVDDASGDGSAAWVAAAVPEARLLVNARNLGFTAAARRGLEAARGEYVLLLNADCELLPGTLPALVVFLDRSPAHAAAAPRLVDAEGATLRTCMNLPRLATALWHGTPLERWRPASRELRRYFARELDHERDADVEQPPGACLLVRRAVLERLGGLDPAMELYFSDVDLSRRLRDAGLRTRYLASARAVHAVGASTAQRPDRLLRWHADRLAYYRRHHGRAGAAWVKLCVLLAAADHLARGELRASAVLRPLLTLLAR